MTRPQEQFCKGPIPGLLLPPRAWKALGKENIETVEQLRANLDRLEWLPGVGKRTATTIRQEVNRVTSGRRGFDPSPWSA